MNNSNIDTSKNQVYPWNQGLWQRLTRDLSQAPQALLLSGIKGLGKRQLATQYASLLLDNDDVFYHSNHPDCHVLKAENELVEGQLLSDYAQRYIQPTNGKAKPKSVITVDQIRKLIEQITQHAQMSGQKVIIIDGADRMNTNAANALLKTLEEPVSKTSFILICDVMEHLPATIKSRCVVIPMRAPDVEIGINWLNQQTDDVAAKSYLSMAGRAPLAALELSKAEHIVIIREIFTSLNGLLAGSKTPLDTAKDWQKFPAKEIVDMLQKLLIDSFKLAMVSDNSQTCSDDDLFFPVQRDWIKKISKNTSKIAMSQTLDATTEAKRLLNTSVDEKLILESLTFSFAKMVETTL